MTHLHELLVRNLRFFRKKKGISQLAFSEKIGISPNYLNAVENGKNFPSPEVLQIIVNTLEIMPYQLFLEEPLEMQYTHDMNSKMLIQEFTSTKQKLVKEIDDIIQKLQAE